jgi:hypothetical protein
VAHVWRAVVLIDEADVFLRQRGKGDESLKRNALVGMFLRTLEYYRGVLIMTTNCLRQMDSAMASRTNLCVEYSALCREDRKRLWELFRDSRLQFGRICQGRTQWPRGEFKPSIVKMAKANALSASSILSSHYVKEALGAYRNMFQGIRGSVESMYI